MPRIDAVIKRSGQFIQAVLDSPTWCYTVGNAELGLPELFLSGVPVDAAQQILNVAGQRMRDQGKAFDAGSYITQLATMPMRVDPIHPSQVANRFFFAFDRMQFLGRDPREVKGLHLVWPDQRGIFPGEPGFDTRFGPAQPVMTLPYLEDPQGNA